MAFATVTKSRIPKISEQKPFMFICSQDSYSKLFENCTQMKQKHLTCNEHEN